MFVTECSCAAVETGWDDPLSETLEKEVEDARKMVSALQVHADWRAVRFWLISSLIPPNPTSILSLTCVTVF